MNIIEELKLHIDAIANVVKEDPKFFSSIIVYIDQLRKIVRSSSEEINREDLELFGRKIEEFYAKYRRQPGSRTVYIPPRQTANSDSIVGEINESIKKLISLDEDSFKALLAQNTTQQIQQDIHKTASDNCIFIGHGRSQLWARLKIYIENELGINTIEFESESRVGDSIIPILEKILGQATFALLVLTAEDETEDGSMRARQNVIHEAGLFQGRLGFKKAVILKQEGIEDFSNIAGLQYIGFNGDQIEQTFYELQRVLKREEMIQ